MRAAIQTGILCGLLIGFCFLLSGLMGRALSLDPLVPLSMMAGVLLPAAMVASGMLARWALYSPFGERQLPHPALASLASGLVTALSGAALCLTMRILSGGMFPAYTINIDAAGLLVIFVAYTAMAAIGGGLYPVVFPETPGSDGRHDLSTLRGRIEDDERRAPGPVIKDQ